MLMRLWSLYTIPAAVPFSKGQKEEEKEELSEMFFKAAICAYFIFKFTE